MKDIKKRIIIFSTIFILITTSIVPIQAGVNKQNLPLQTTQKNDVNILGYITVEWDSWWAVWNFSLLKPKYDFIQSDTRIFVFDEIDGIIQMNFTIVCKMRLLNTAIFPRWAQFEVYIPSEAPYILTGKSVGIWKGLSWKYCNITVGPDKIEPLVTNGSNATLIPMVGIRSIFGENLSYWFGNYTVWEPITVVPIPIEK